MSTSRSRRTGVTGVVLPVVLSGTLLLGGCVIGDVDRGDGGEAPTTPTTESDAPAPTTSPGREQGTEQATEPDAGADLEVPETSGAAGVVLLDGGQVRSGGTMADLADAAWSTSKVPLAIAALNEAQDSGGDVSAQVTQAITVSDNDAAESLWASLGQPADAAAAVQAVLREGGDTDTVVPAEKRRPEFSTFGQTVWTLADQATFASNLRCVGGSGPVVGAMGQVATGQDYGLGQFDGAVFKGGWGPGEDGSYMVRQFGLVPAQDGSSVPVAVAATAPDGSYESAQGVLNTVVESLRESISGAHGVAADGDC